MESNKTEKEGLKEEVPDLKRKLQDVENNQKVQGRRKPMNGAMGSQEIKQVSKGSRVRSLI